MTGCHNYSPNPRTGRTVQTLLPNDHVCAACLLAGIREQAITVYAGNSVCDTHLVEYAAGRLSSGLQRSRAAMGFRRNVSAALAG